MSDPPIRARRRHGNPQMSVGTQCTRSRAKDSKIPTRDREICYGGLSLSQECPHEALLVYGTSQNPSFGSRPPIPSSARVVIRHSPHLDLSPRSPLGLDLRRGWTIYDDIQSKALL
nr:uncharacterized protein CTRU02_04563 [Colletotrichum truncatum]KAF6795753.1 hypothetical protein CTRU02_04563 [Colletotrichum truncatum]